MYVGWGGGGGISELRSDCDIWKTHDEKDSGFQKPKRNETKQNSDCESEGRLLDCDMACRPYYFNIACLLDCNKPNFAAAYIQRETETRERCVLQ